MAKKKQVIETAVMPEEFIEEKIIEKAPIYATVIGGNLNIRADKDKSSEKIGVLDNGSTIEIIERGDDWCQIAGGYVMTEFLSF